jgi:hypothetical protein
MTSINRFPAGNVSAYWTANTGKRRYYYGHTNPTMSCYATSITPTVSVSMFVRRSRTDHRGIIEFIHLLVRAASALGNQKTWLEGGGGEAWEWGWGGGWGKLPQHAGIVGVITMGYMIRRIGLFVNVITRLTSALCSNNMETVCAWYIMAGLDLNTLIMQKRSVSWRISTYAAHNIREQNLHSYLWDKISYVCSERKVLDRNI